MDEYEGFEIGTLIDAIQAARVRKALLEKEAEKYATDIRNLEFVIIKTLGDLKLERATHNGVTVTPKQETFPHVEDWARFQAYILETGYLHLLEKRPTVLAYREMLELGRQVPGVVPFVKTKLSVRTA